MSDTRIDVLEDRVQQLESEIEFLKKSKPGRKAKIIPSELRKAGVCAINPDIDSSECPDANVYRHQQGCRGTACVIQNKSYYDDYRASKVEIAVNGG